jgi:hypothetical protein
MTEGRLII